MDSHRPSPLRRLASSSHTVSLAFVDGQMDGRELDLHSAKLFSHVIIQITTLRCPLAHRYFNIHQKNIKYSSNWFFNYKTMRHIVLNSFLMQMQQAVNVSSSSFYHLVSILLLFYLKKNSVLSFMFHLQSHNLILLTLEFIIQFVSIVQPSGMNLHGTHK